MSPASQAVKRFRNLYRSVFSRMRRNESRLADRLAGRVRFQGVEPLEPRLLLSGTPYVVNSLLDVVVADDGVVTLREAILAANTNTAVTGDVQAGSSTETDRITFDQAALSAEAGVAIGAPMTITLDAMQLEINDDLELIGLGDELLTIDAAGRSRVFLVGGSQTEVSLSGLTITGGQATMGGGIYNSSGTLTLTNATVSGNAAEAGGGIYSTGTLTLTNCKVIGNAAYGIPGG